MLISIPQFLVNSCCLLLPFHCSCLCSFPEDFVFYAVIVAMVQSSVAAMSPQGLTTQSCRIFSWEVSDSDSPFRRPV